MDQPSPRSAVDFPPGFAPLMGTKAQFIAATTPDGPPWPRRCLKPHPVLPNAKITLRQQMTAARSRSSEQVLPPAAKIKDQEAAVTPGQTTEPEVPPIEKSELGSPQTSTSTLPKANTPNRIGRRSTDVTYPSDAEAVIRRGSSAYESSLGLGDHHGRYSNAPLAHPVLAHSGRSSADRLGGHFTRGSGASSCCGPPTAEWTRRGFRAP